MPLAAGAPWALCASLRLFATSVLLMPLSEAVVAHPRPMKFSLLSIHQVPGPKPQYVEYGPPEFTTFNDSASACLACIEYFPEKLDGKRFHSRLYYDKESGGTWDKACRAGLCDFRDPQTQPVGGIIGKGVGPGGEPDGRTCITRDPVQWYADCEPIAKSNANSLVEVTRYCSYKEQIYIPPPADTVSRLAGSKGNAWRRIGESEEQCMVTIEKQGSALMDTMTFCDSDLKSLSGCCESIFGALSCVAETAVSNGIANVSGSIFTNLDHDGSQMMDIFNTYCVPLCQNSKDEFCEKFPYADICVKMEDCSHCTAAGGIWCPKLKSCHCPGPDPPCIKPPVTTPLQCALNDRKMLRSIKKSKVKAKTTQQQPDKKAEEEEEVKESEEALCKYSRFAQKWFKSDSD